ncbi:hypothetical protein AYI70_g5509 [Smittium culicis]|uniref:LITAF domain-containing protein n=1 Tax=Smittium culicis TaxID=133412 RepID=A0A1R1XU61_9FUNG|nr:hypothetical protein AYI70_g6958 [Smittium culicis]OMJ18182.1 hypothetical protein AYI70_g5509 [Smittium culicis]
MMTNNDNKDKNDFIKGNEHNSNDNQTFTDYRNIQDANPQNINQTEKAVNGSNYGYPQGDNSGYASNPPINDVKFMKSPGIPINITCPGCKKTVLTSIKRKAGGKTLVAVLGVGLIFWPLMWVPLVMKSLKKKVHICPNCKSDLGDEILIQLNRLESTNAPIYH